MAPMSKRLIEPRNSLAYVSINRLSDVALKNFLDTYCTISFTTVINLMSCAFVHLLLDLPYKWDVAFVFFWIGMKNVNYWKSKSKIRKRMNKNKTRKRNSPETLYPHNSTSVLVTSGIFCMQDCKRKNVNRMWQSRETFIYITCGRLDTYIYICTWVGMKLWLGDQISTVRIITWLIMYINESKENIFIYYRWAFPKSISAASGLIQCINVISLISYDNERFSWVF